MRVKFCLALSVSTKSAMGPAVPHLTSISIGIRMPAAMSPVGLLSSATSAALSGFGSFAAATLWRAPSTVE